MHPMAGTPEGIESRVEQVEKRLKEYADASSLVDRCLELLARARAELAATRTMEAGNAVLRAECLLERAERSAATVRRWRIWITLYALGFFYAVLVVVSRGELLVGRAVFALRMPAWLPPAPYFVWGALGGVAACLYGLVWHASQRDFDSEYLTWYWVKPIMGMVFGPLAYYLAEAGLLATGVRDPQVNQHALLYLAAFVLAFSERLSLRLIDRVATSLFGPAQPPAPSPPVPRTAGASESS